MRYTITTNSYAFDDEMEIHQRFDGLWYSVHAVHSEMGELDCRDKLSLRDAELWFRHFVNFAATAKAAAEYFDAMSQEPPGEVEAL